TPSDGGRHNSREKVFAIVPAGQFPFRDAGDVRLARLSAHHDPTAADERTRSSERIVSEVIETGGNSGKAPRDLDVERREAGGILTRLMIEHAALRLRVVVEVGMP